MRRAGAACGPRPLDPRGVAPGPGAGLWATATGFGWFAYGPIGEDLLSAMVVVTGQRYAAVAAFGATLLLLAARTGFALGRRPGRTTRPGGSAA